MVSKDAMLDIIGKTLFVRLVIGYQTE